MIKEQLFKRCVEEFIMRLLSDAYSNQELEDEGFTFVEENGELYNRALTFEQYLEKLSDGAIGDSVQCRYSYLPLGLNKGVTLEKGIFMASTKDDAISYTGIPIQITEKKTGFLKLKSKIVDITPLPEQIIIISAEEVTKMNNKRGNSTSGFEKTSMFE